MDDMQTKLKKYEQWLVILRILSVIFLIAGIAALYWVIKSNGNPGLMVICLLSALMFFMAYREKSNSPRPGSPEYEAIEKAHAAKLQANREHRYRKQHPFTVARELVENNKTNSKEAVPSPGAGQKRTASDLNTAVSKKETAKKTKTS